MPNSPVHQELKHLRRKSWVSFAIMVGCVAWATSATWGKWDSDAEIARLVEQHKKDITAIDERYIERVEAQRERIEAQQQTIDIQQMQTHALHTLLRKEQASAGNYESKYVRFRDLAKSQSGYHGYYKRLASEQQQRICHLEQLARDNGVKLYTDPGCKK